MKIKDLCKEKVDGWDGFEIAGQMAFINIKYGITLHASIKSLAENEHEKILHVSIGPIRSAREDLNDEEHCSFMLEKTPKILTDFFDKRTFQRMPPNPGRPDINHYLSGLEE